MNLYVIRRNVWQTAEELEATASRSAKIGNVVEEDDGTLGTVCIYQAVH